MDDATAVLAGQTKKYNIPLSHFEHKYIQNCADAKELERIYKELTGGEIGSFLDLEKLTLDRIREIKPNSHVLRQDKAPLDRSALPEDERQQFTEFLKQMKAPTTSQEHQNNGVNIQPIRGKTAVSKANPPISSAPVIKKTDKQKRIVPRGYDEWGKLEKAIIQEVSSGDDEEKPPAKSTPPSNPTDEKRKRLRMAEEHRQSGNTAFRSNNYQQSINSYSSSIMLDDTNPVVYMNRAIAHFKLSNYDASLNDCSQVLANDPNHVKALFRRASCRIAKQHYTDAKSDLDRLLSIDPENNDAKDLLKQIPSVAPTKGVRIPISEDDGEEEEEEEVAPAHSIPFAPVKIPIVEVDEEEEEEDNEEQVTGPTTSPSMNIDIPPKTLNHARPCIDSQEASPAMLDHYLHHQDDMNRFQHDIQYQLSSLDAEADPQQDQSNDVDNDADDGMQLGDEADVGLSEHMSDDEGHASRIFNVSPPAEDDDNDVPELIDQKSLTTPPFSPNTPPVQHREPLDLRLPYQVNNTYNQGDFSARSRVQHMHDERPLPTTSTSYASPQQRITDDTDRTASVPHRPSGSDLHDDQISSSNFGSTIQSWLRDTVQLEISRRPSSRHARPWSKSVRPWALDKLQRDIERFNRLREFGNAIEASKKMLKNGILDYHSHAEHIVNVLVLCAQCYSNVNKHCATVQYASEALQYNRMDSTALICRAKAFEKEDFLLFSYADYARIPASDHCYSSAQRACEKLAIDLDESEGDNWRDRVPNDTNDNQRYLSYLKRKDEPDDNLYDWYRKHANQLYLDACYIFAIHCYTFCTELQPKQHLPYLNRAACYLKVFEPQKAIDDCDRVLEMVSNNPRALYRKACAFKMLGNKQLYVLTLKDLIKLQPNNQIVLSEFYTARQETVPRQMRRLRTNPPTTGTSSTLPNALSTTIETNTPALTTVIEETLLSYEQLEVLRTQKAHPFSSNVSYQFTQQLEVLKLTDIEGQCLLMLRLPAKGLFKFASSASAKLVETIIRVCRTMVHAEKRYQQEHKSHIAPFSYIQFCFQLLVQLTTLPRVDLALSMIDVDHRTSLDDLLAYYSSISATLTDVDKLNRLRK